MRLSRYATSVVSAVTVATLLHCGGGSGGGSTPMTSQGDTLAVQRIVGTWEATTPKGHLSMTLCEDLQADGSDSQSCECKHVVRGDGRGKTESVDLSAGSNGGCAETTGGCFYDVSAFVVGTVQGDMLSVPQLLRGSFALKTHDADDPYAYPYRMHLGLAAAATYPQSLNVNGDLTNGDTIENGELSFSLDLPPGDAGSSADDAGALDASEDASVDAPASDDGAAPVPPAPTASGGPSATGSTGGSTQTFEQGGIVFHRIDAAPAACAH